MIDTKAIRKRVMELAVSGSLSEAFADDEPVSDNLKSYIPNEEINLPSIPDRWRYCRFDALFINRDSERIPVSLADRKKLSKIYDYYGASGVIDKVETYLFDEPLLLIGEDGANLIARSTPIAFIAKGKYWVNNHAHVLQMTEYMNIEFAKLAINAMNLDAYITGAAQPKLSQGNMNKIAIPVPPLAEQQRIVERVESIFSLLDEIDEAQASFVKNQESLRTKLIETVLFAGNYGKITTEEFSKHMDLLSGRDLSASEYNDKGKGIPYYTGASNFDNGGLTVNRWTESPAVISNQGDLLVTCKGTVGKMAYATETAHIARQIMAIRPKDIDVEYAYYFMEYYVATLKKKAKGLIPGIERKDLLAAPFPFREEQEQKRIVDKLNELLPLCS